MFSDYRKTSSRSGKSNAGEMKRFAERNLSVHTKGLLRKKITIHTMLSWTREPIKKPMIMTKTKQVCDKTFCFFNYTENKWFEHFT